VSDMSANVIIQYGLTVRPLLRLRQEFADYDTNGDGAIDHEEFLSASSPIPLRLVVCAPRLNTISLTDCLPGQDDGYGSPAQKAFEKRKQDEQFGAPQRSGPQEVRT
jgi:hypothetical protein